MYDERFARQYRYEPPSEFPQTSPFTGIVHHLSGPNKYTHAQTSPSRSVGYWCKHLSNHFHYAQKFHHQQTRICVILLGPCFKTGRREQFSHHVECQEGDQFTQTVINSCTVVQGASQHNLTKKKIGWKVSTSKNIRSAGAELPCPKSYPHPQKYCDLQGKKHHMLPDQNPQQNLHCCSGASP